MTGDRRPTFRDFVPKIARCITSGRVECQEHSCGHLPPGKTLFWASRRLHGLPWSGGASSSPAPTLTRICSNGRYDIDRSAIAPGFRAPVDGVPACEFTNTRVRSPTCGRRAICENVDELSGADDPGAALEDLALRMSGPLDAAAH